MVPHNLIGQWSNYIINCTNLSYHIITRKTHFKDQIDDYNYTNILLISNNKFNEFSKKYKQIDSYIFSRIFFDEADTINISNSKTIKSFFYWFISSNSENLLFPLGTYYNKILKNKNNYSYIEWEENGIDGIKNSGFIKNIFYNLCVNDFNFIQYIILKNKDNYIDDSLNLPKINETIIDCKMDTQKNIVCNAVSNKILKFLNADNLQGIINELDINVENETNIIKIITQNILNRLHNKKQKLNYLKSIIINDEVKKNKVKKIKSEIDILESRKNEINNKLLNYKDELCVICYEPLSKPVAVTKCCKNMFCLKCLTKSIYMLHKNSCPMCRKEFNDENDFCVLDNKFTKSNKLNKINSLLNLINNKNNKNKKFLIYSDYDNTFKNIIYKLKDSKINFFNLDSNYKLNKDKINKFKNGENNILLLNSKNFKKGLNLEMTTDIIIYHKINDIIKTKIISLAQRTGRTNSLNVHYLYYNNEIN